MKNCLDPILLKNKVLKTVGHGSRSGGKLLQPAGAFSAGAESPVDRRARFPQARKVLSTGGCVFRSGGKLRRPADTFSAGAESPVDHLRRFPQRRKALSTVRDDFRIRGMLCRPSGTVCADAGFIFNQILNFNPLNNYCHE
jgi:hypothetical protein